MVMVIAGASSLQGWRSIGTVCLWWGLSLVGRQSDNQRFIAGALGADTINAETWRWVRRPSPPTLWLNRGKGLANPGNLWCGEYVLLVAEWGSSSKSDCLYERMLWVQRGVFYPPQLCHWKRSYPCCQTKPYISQILNIIQCYLFVSFES